MSRYAYPLSILEVAHAAYRDRVGATNVLRSLAPHRRAYAVASASIDRGAVRHHAGPPRKGASLQRSRRTDDFHERSAPSLRLQPRAKRHADLETPWLSDPVELTNRVRSLVRKDYEKALELTHNACKTMQCTVSYNWLIDDCLRRGAVNEAFGLYNDMKKRRQFPDAYTITVLLRGLKDHPVARTPNNLARAMAVYQSLSEPKSRVNRNIIHTNTMLALCAAHKDMSAMWSTVATIPNAGPEAANVVTYSILLQAIRGELGNKEGPFKQSAATCTAEELGLRRQAVADGKRIWADVASQWRQGNLRIDESLVLQMSWVLRLGLRQQDFDDILSLVQQTMQVPRFVDHSSRPTLKGSGSQDTAMQVDDSDLFQSPPPPTESTPTTRRAGARLRSAKSIFVTPSAPTLSLVLSACQELQAWKAAHSYWEHLTGERNVIPDCDNYNSYLRILRATRSSARTVDLLRQLSHQQAQERGFVVRPGTYLIAMSTCTRDSANPNALEHAAAVVDLLLQDGSTKRTRVAEKNLEIFDRYIGLCNSIGQAQQSNRAIEQLAPLLEPPHDVAWKSIGLDKKAKFVSGLQRLAGRAAKTGERSPWEQRLKKIEKTLKR